MFDCNVFTFYGNKIQKFDKKAKSNKISKGFVQCLKFLENEYNEIEEIKKN